MAIGSVLSEHLAPLIVCALFTVAVTGYIFGLAQGLGAVAAIRPDRWHSKPVALHGGVGILIVVIGAAWSWQRSWFPSLPGEGMAVSASPEAWIVLSALTAGLAGFFDDLFQFRPATKLALLFVAASVMIVGLGSARITGMTWIDLALTYGWILLVANAFNMLDNMDGIAVGSAISTLIGTAVVAASMGRAELALLALTIAAIAVGFLVWNRSPARIFMGDSGSLFFGTLLAGLTAVATGWMGPDAGESSITQLGLTSSAAAIAVSVMLLFAPLADFTFVTITRSVRGQSPMVGGRDHTTHRIALLGWSKRATRAVFASTLIIGPVTAVLAIGLPPLMQLVVLVALVWMGWRFGFALARAVPIQATIATGTTAEIAAEWMRRATDGIDSIRRELLDAVLVAACTVAGYAIRFGWPLPADSTIVLRRLVPVTVASCLVANALVGVYESKIRSWRNYLGRAALASAIGFLIAIGALVMFDWLPVGFSRMAALVGGVAWCFVQSNRIAWRSPLHSENGSSSYTA
ncbi:MAG: MraY family glycosyltransferase [Planctomycetota bacterium]|nr:MraY family glycosyltransferase [Planctomycetota bacterium]